MPRGSRAPANQRSYSACSTSSIPATPNTLRCLCGRAPATNPAARNQGRSMSEAPRPSLPVRLPADETVLLSRPPYAVILHNDDYNSMNHVVQSLLACVPELEQEGAVRVMLTAHVEGRAHVISCPLERAELYRARREVQGLTATIEKAGAIWLDERPWGGTPPHGAGLTGR